MFGIIHAIPLVELDEARQALGEVRVIFLFRLCPLHFGKGSHAWEYHILCMFGSGDILCP